MAIRHLARKGRSFLAYGWTEQLIFPVVFVLLGVARAAILLLPFRRYVPVLGRPDGTREIALAPLDARRQARARSVGRVVRAAATVTPWESLCLAQALAACVLLRISGVPYIAYLGVAKGAPGEDPLKAHAWIMAGKTAVTGGRNDGRFAVVGAFRQGSGGGSAVSSPT